MRWQGFWGISWIESEGWICASMTNSRSSGTENRGFEAAQQAMSG